MPKTKISEFSATAGNNTDIDGINIAEGCAPSGINDAIRELMAQLKDFQAGTAGDSFNGPVGTTTAAAGAFTTLSASSTVSGTGFSNYLASPPTIGGTTPNTGSFTTLTTSSTVTHNGGTANGVAYLNGSKVLTTGSALTFDGTALGAARAIFTAADNAYAVAFNATTGNARMVPYDSTYGSSALVAYSAGYAGYGPFTVDALNHRWWVSGTEGMRLTSTGLGIGTSSPATKLHVASAGSVSARVENTSGTGAAFLQVKNTAGSTYLGQDATGGYLLTDYAAPLLFYTNNTERMRLDSSGNLGLGVTPSAWGSSNRALQVATAGAVWSPGGADTRLSNNQYRNSASSRIYIANGYAQEYAQDSSGNHVWFTAPSGTAGNTISFTQAMTLTQGGQLLAGATVENLSRWGRALFNYPCGTSNSVIGLQNSTARAANNLYGIVFADNTDESNAAVYVRQTGTNNGADLLFGTNAGTGGAGLGAVTERARITSGGDFLVACTTTGVAVDGCRLTTGPVAQFSRSNADVLSCNRNGTDGAVATFYKAGTAVGTISVTGSATAYNTSSDYRLKENQQPLTGSGAFIDALKPKTWNWTADGSKGVGFIAHEVQEVSPGSVVGTKDAVDEEGKPVYQAMEYGSAEFIANIIAELQSLRARVAQLEAK